MKCGATQVALRAPADNYLPPQDFIHMPVELLVILGAEASILGFVAAMTLHAKRMDVLSGRSFERPIVSPGGNNRGARPIKRYAI
jgi:hypothetical protein